MIGGIQYEVVGTHPVGVVLMKPVLANGEPVRVFGAPPALRATSSEPGGLLTLGGVVHKIASRNADGTITAVPASWPMKEEAPPSPAKQQDPLPLALAIDSALAEHQGIESCLEAASEAGTALNPKLYLEFRLSPGGVISEAHLVGKDWEDSSVGRCVGGAVEGLKMTPPSDGKARKVRWALVAGRY